MAPNFQKKIMRMLERKPRYHNRVYEKRAIVDGVEIRGCAADIETCGRLFLDDLLVKLPKIRGEQAEDPNGRKPKSILFLDFAENWFEEVHQKKVTEDTYYKDLKQFQKHIKPFFEGKKLREITAGDCMRYMMQFREKNIDRTMENCDGLLRQIFQYAVACEIIDKHPMAAIKRVKAYRKNGVPLSKSEEQAFLQAIGGTKYEPVFLLSLYTGLRPCELSSASVQEGFIVARNRKQKDKRVVFKKIPITPMLEPHLPLIRAAIEDGDLLNRDERHYNVIFQEFCESHTLYDLRTTFATRCQECGVPEQVTQIWMGHVPSTLLGRVYTKFTDEYLLKEGKKVKY